MQKIKVGYLGPRGSFSEEAAILYQKKLGTEIVLVPYSSYEFGEGLKKGEIHKAIMPKENTIEGPISWLLDTLSENFPFCIENEFVLDIKQNLLGNGKLSDVKVVYSKSEALNQCRNFLEKHRLSTQAMDSTSSAVKLIAEKGDAFKLAAIGSERAAKIYKLPIIVKNISDNGNNQTRFVVLGKKANKKTDRDKTSLIFGVKDKAGALFRALEVFDVLSINMTSIHSRPSKARLGDYIFFIDIEGHQDDPKMKVALETLKNKVSSLKVLGSYPSA